MWAAIQQIVRFEKLNSHNASHSSKLQKTMSNSTGNKLSCSTETTSVASTTTTEYGILELPHLPDDILCYIFASCEPRELLLGCALANKHWNELITCGRVYLLEPWWGKKKRFNQMDKRRKILFEKEDVGSSNFCFCKSNLSQSH